jgi:hypothetical protein
MRNDNDAPVFTGENVSALLTLRDYFAAAALTGLLAKGDNDNRGADIAQAFWYADHMLEARKQ